MIDFILDLICELSDAATSFVDGSPDSPGHTIHGGPDDVNIHGARPTDIHGNAVGKDAWGRPNNIRIHD